MVSSEFNYLTKSSESLLAKLLTNEITLPYEVIENNLDLVKEMGDRYIQVEYQMPSVDTHLKTWLFGGLSATVLHITKEGERYFEMKELHEKNNNKSNILNIYGDVNSSQIQQATANSQQQMANEFDYNKALSIIAEITKYVSLDSFSNDFGVNSEKTKEFISEIHSMIENKEEPSKIKKALIELKNLSVGVTGSLIATGIVSLITPLL